MQFSGACVRVSAWLRLCAFVCTRECVFAFVFVGAVLVCVWIFVCIIVSTVRERVCMWACVIVIAVCVWTLVCVVVSLLLKTRQQSIVCSSFRLCTLPYKEAGWQVGSKKPAGGSVSSGLAGSLSLPSLTQQEIYTKFSGVKCYNLGRTFHPKILITWLSRDFCGVECYACSRKWFSIHA